jgi:hypothetical protein
VFPFVLPTNAATALLISQDTVRSSRSASSLRRNLDRDFLKPILRAMGVYVKGSRFHIFRRFRESVLQASEVRGMLIDRWIGHANGDTAARYAKQLLENVPWRTQQVANAGLGFTLPALPQRASGQDGQVVVIAEQEANQCKSI